MIPTFPEFKNLEWSDREVVEKFTASYAQYSDYNFVSMWCWNTRNKMRLSQLNGNLVLLFNDYLTEIPFLSFIGSTHLAETTRMLLDYSKLHYHDEILKLVPEEVASGLCESEFIVSADESAHDYIMQVEHLSNLNTLPGSNNIAAKNCRKFLANYPSYTVRVHTAGAWNQEEFISLFTQWAKAKNLDHYELNEFSAFEKFISNNETANALVSLWDGAVMMCFAAYEILNDGYAVCHFAKASREYQGVYDVLYFEMGKILKQKDVKYLNFEQDLGIPGLRQFKRKYKPEFYLKKYCVQNRQE